ncbi:acetyltransferase [Paenibacillus sp. S150]|uniref:acetyltransferase n=1 Tax=Paenibacillus sp. S150 TaxID=2749826 RepID=UPI001C5793BE|nr:acetyltransferase [Paenibacillus sp. S150]MBW4081655.1 acetyltransferase [Paenibacillus sp. S150]
MSSLPLIVLGGGGHAKVCLDLISRQNLRCLGYVAPAPSPELDARHTYMGTDEIINNFLQEEILLVNGVGKISGSAVRKRIFENFKSRGYSFATIIHDSCIIADDTLIQEGAQLMAGVIINTGSIIEANAIINTRAVIEHDCFVGRHSHVSPGAVVCGGCYIGSHVHVGAGSTLIQKIKVGDESIIGAGSLVLRDVKEDSLVFGVPAKEVIT